MRKLFLLIGLIIFFSYNNLFAKPEDEESVSIEDVKKLGLYERIEKLPKGLILKFNTGCDDIICRGKKAGSEV